MKKKNKMKTKHFIAWLKARLSLIFFITAIGLVTFACDDDEDFGPTGPDMRLDGKDIVLALHVNPLTGEEYTQEELDLLDYDPGVEEYYQSSQKMELFFWMQQKPDKIEVTLDGSGDNVTEFGTFVRDDRPDLADYKNGYGYSAKWKLKISELGIGIGSSQTYNIKVTYYDVGIDGFKEPSVREIKFTVHEIEDISVGSPSDFLVGYWRFNDPSNLLKATVGNDLVLNGAASHQAVVGVDGNDGAAHLDVGTWYDVVDHGVGSSFTMVWDVMVSTADLGKYICLLQNLPANNSDGSLYINPSGGFWFNGGPSDFNGTIIGDQWHRISSSYDGGEVLLYVDGVEIYTGSLNWPIDPAKFIILGENSSNAGNGEDNPITISEFMVFNTAFDGSELAAFPPLGTPAVETITSSLKGRWAFDDASDLLKASCGDNLVLNGAASHQSVTGARDGDGAAHLDVGTWYDVTNHGLGTEYTMIWDVMVADGDLGKYIPLLQNNIANDSDGSLYINPSGGFWFNGGTSGFGGTIIADQWHRIVASYNNGNLLFYVDGEEIYATTLSWPLDASKLILFGENSSNAGNGEDNPISVSDVLIFDSAFNSDQIESLPSIDKPVF